MSQSQRIAHIDRIIALTAPETAPTARIDAYIAAQDARYAADKVVR